MKRFSILLCAVLLCLLLPVTALAADAVSLDLAAGSIEIYESEGVTYCVQNGVTQATTGSVIIRQTDNATATANTVTVSGGASVVTIAGLNIKTTSYESPIIVNRNAILELKLLGNSTITATSSCAGIHVPSGATLIVSGTGSISVTGAGSDIGGAAGIGSTSYSVAGSIIINSGTVHAQGGQYGAGIGSGNDGNGGSITINGGNVTAIGGMFAAGIGGGYRSNSGNITINGGTVYASKGAYGGGYSIGGGQASEGGTVTINGGIITADNLGDDLDAVTISKNAIINDELGGKIGVYEVILMDKQPLSSSAHLGNNPKVSVTARGHSGLSYQWEISSDNKTWSDLEGETSSATDSFAMTEELVGSYLRCKLTNGWGNVAYTDSAQIYVLAFAQQPTSVEANLNDMAVFEATSTCANVTYQWQRSYDDGASWEDVPGETYSTLIVNATLAESAAKYRCVITATNGDQLVSDVVSVNLDLGTLVTYTVQDFWQDADGSGYTVKSQQIFEGLSGETVTATGVDYDGFALNRGKSTLSGTVAEDSSLVLTRYFDRNTYSIIFDTNGGGSLPALEALYGAPVEAPGEPARYGHIFDGWYADKALTEAFVFDTMPLDGATVYAKWTPVGADRGIEYTVNGLSLRDSTTFEVLEGIPEGKFLVEVSITNLSATQTDTVLLVYYTAQGQMVGMNYMFANTPVGYTAVFGAAVDNSGGNIGIIRAFVLPTLGNPTPLADGVNEIR